MYTHAREQLHNVFRSKLTKTSHSPVCIRHYPINLSAYFCKIRFQRPRIFKLAVRRCLLDKGLEQSLLLQQRLQRPRKLIVTRTIFLQTADLTDITEPRYKTHCGSPSISTRRRIFLLYPVIAHRIALQQRMGRMYTMTRA